MDRASADALVEKYREDLEAGNHVANALVLEPNEKMFVDWTPYLGHDYTDVWDTTFPIERLKELGTKMRELPEGFVMQRQVSKVIDDRLKMQTGEMPLNWGAAEVLAYATILDDGYLVRLTGEDVGRGTFSHRHAKLHNQVDGSVYIPLCHIKENQPRTAIYDSLLSEMAVLAFEYGYSTTLPKSLVIWEAQFGDFANCAQVVIDQFISSGETKWERVCGLTLLLPHGYEGQGPEHSSARLERFLQLCAEENMQVITPTTPAQIFHAMRRQAVRPIRKPMIVTSPKSLLRHKLATSTLEELATGTFQTVIDEVDQINKQDVTRVVLCGGKVYYDLLEKRREQNLNIAVVRVEQLYPYPEQRLAEVLEAYPNMKELVWCQEEPKNQGAWLFIAPRLYEGVMKGSKQIQISYAGRDASAAPACGSPYLHAKQQAQLVNDALAIVADQSGETK